MGIVGNLDQYTQFQAAEAMRDAAANPSGGSEAMNMGLGLAMAQRLSETLARPAQPAPAPQPAPPAPPPLPGANRYFVAVNNQQTGPFGLKELQQQAQGGQLTHATLVWTQGMANWTPASEVAEINALFANAPPPLPNA
jgi:hypothetical protein